MANDIQNHTLHNVTEAKTRKKCLLHQSLSSMTDNLKFEQKFVDSAVDHVNEDHRDAMIDILKGLRQANWVVDAELISFDKEKIEAKGFGANQETKTFEISFDEPLEKPNQFRHKLIEMLQQARALLNNDQS